MKTLTPSEVYSSLRLEAFIRDASIGDKVELRQLSADIAGKDFAVPYRIRFKRCHFAFLDAGYCHYLKSVTLSDCTFAEAEFTAAYLYMGLTLDRCVFENDIGLIAMGGHNRTDQPVRVRNCVFKGLVDMNDAWFEGPVEISGCQFIKGTNLLGNKGKPYQVTFDQEPRLLDNSGPMDLDFDWLAAHPKTT